jgi:hypothetical protein
MVVVKERAEIGWNECIRAASLRRNLRVVVVGERRGEICLCLTHLQDGVTYNHNSRVPSYTPSNESQGCLSNKTRFHGVEPHTRDPRYDGE